MLLPITSNVFADHLLSYFLGGDLQSGMHANERNAPDYATSKDGRSGAFPHPGASQSCHSSATESIMEEEEEEEDDEDREHEPVPPPTPAVQFYSHSHAATLPGGTTRTNYSIPENPASATMTSGSSSSSLSSMAAALVSGGPVMYQQIQHQQQQHQLHQLGKQPRNNSNGSGDFSPISPAAMIGSGHENLMLPPLGRISSKNQATAGQQQQQQQQHRPTADKQRHLMWLQELNDRAKAAGQLGAGETGPPQPPQPQPVPSHFPYAGAPHGGGQQHVMGYPLHQHHHALAPNPGMMYSQVAHMQHHMVESPALSAAEAEEKRVKRLKRNRESARKSRRRKKERLATLEAQVNKLQNKIEVERKKRIHAMIGSLTACRIKAISELLQYKGDDAVSSDLVPIIRNTGPRSQISLTVTDFQYITLKQMLLPKYEKVLLWMSLHEESFFTAGKEEYVQREAGKQVSRAATGRISSKQIGDEMTNSPKGKPDSGPGLQDMATSEDDYNGDRPNQTSYANDAPRYWPLFCYGMGFSVDQEDRFLAAQKRVQQIPGLAESRAQMAAAQRTTESLKGAVESICSVVSQREEQTFLSVLDPEQVAAYQDWLVANRDRCRSALPVQESPGGKDTSMPEICRKLDEVLQISKIEK
jgi:hypothetical protein